MKELKIFAVPIDKADVDNDNAFIEQAKRYGYVWTSMKKSKDVNLYGLVVKTILV